MISKEHSETGELDATKPAFPERKKEKRGLECILTQDERNDHSHTLAQSIQELAQLEDRKKSLVKQLDAEIAEKKAIINKESGIVKEGKEYRDILCEWYLNQPTKGKKQLVRTDGAFKGHGIVATYDMSGEDTQALLKFEEAAKAGGES
jgi:Trp operon repressor